MPTVGDRIKEVREELGWTQEHLAEAAGLSKSFLSDVERSARDIGSDNLLKIANALGASLDYLMRGEEAPKKRQPMIIPPELSQAAQQLKLSYVDTVSLLEAHNSVIATRGKESIKRFEVKDWIDFHHALKKVFDGRKTEK